MKKSAKPKPYHHGNLRQDLIDASLEVIAAQGPEAFTLRDIARRLGVAPSAPYRHFSDKNAVLSAVADECSRRLGDAMDRAAAEASEDPLDRFRRAGVAYVRFAVENPAHFRVMSHARVAEQAPLRDEVADWMKTELARLREAQQHKLLADLPLDHIMLAARCLTYGLARLIVDAQDGLGSLSADAASRLAEDLTQVLGLGLLPRDPLRKEP